MPRRDAPRLTNQQYRERMLARLEESRPLKGAAKVIHDALSAEVKGIENG